jgi:Glycosyltransferase family 87
MIDRQSAIGAPMSSFPAGTAVSAWPFRLLLVAACVGTGLVSVLLGPDNYWDLRYYHLYNPWAYLHGRYLYDVGPAQEQGFLNPTADFLFYGLISSPLNEMPRLVAFIMGALHGLNAAFTLAIACLVLRPPEPRERHLLQAAAWLMGVTGAGFISLIGTATNDLTSSLFVLGSLFGLLKAAEPPAAPAASDAPRNWRVFAWPGLLGGLGVGLKYTSAFYAPGLAVAAVMVAVMRRTFGGLLAYAAAAALAFLAVAGHHMLVLWLDFGNPTFPYLNQIFHSPWWESEAIRDARFQPQNLWHFIIFPFTWTTLDTYIIAEPPVRDWRAAIAYLAMLAGMLAFAARCFGGSRGQAFGRTHGLAIVYAFVIASYVTWVFGFSYLRYAAPLEMLTGIVTVGALLWLFDDRRWRIGSALAVVLLAGVTTVYLDWEKVGHGPSRLRYGDRYVDVRVPPLPTDSVVLIATWDPVAFFIPYAAPGVQYVGIENNYLELSQHNLLAEKVKHLMREPGRPKFVLSVDRFDADKLNALLAHFDLKLGASPCLPIETNLEGHALSLCPAVEA